MCLQAALTRIVQGQAKKGPLRYLERIKVDGVKLGRRAPCLSTCTVSTEAAADAIGSVRLALPFSFEPAEGFSVVVSSASMTCAPRVAVGFVILTGAPLRHM